MLNSSASVSLQVEGDDLCMYDAVKPRESVSQSVNECTLSKVGLENPQHFSGGGATGNRLLIFFQVTLRTGPLNYWKAQQQP